MVASFDQAVCHLAAGIERVGDKVEGMPHIRGTKQMDHLVEQGAPITVAPDEPPQPPQINTQPMTNRTLAQIERRIDKIKALLSGIGEMRPGSLTQQFKDRESQTGPYYQLSYRLDMKSRTDYVSNHALADVRRQVANYKRFEELCEQWVALGIEHSKLKIKLKPKG